MNHQLEEISDLYFLGPYASADMLELSSFVDFRKYLDFEAMDEILKDEQGDQPVASSSTPEASPGEGMCSEGEEEAAPLSPAQSSSSEEKSVVVLQPSPQQQQQQRQRHPHLIRPSELVAQSKNLPDSIVEIIASYLAEPFKMTHRTWAELGLPMVSWRAGKARTWQMKFRGPPTDVSAHLCSAVVLKF
jgi:hypothetical protein